MNSIKRNSWLLRQKCKNVWLVFRDYESPDLFQKSLKRDFDFKTLIYDGRNKKYEFSRIPLDETDTVSIARGITNEIIGFYNDIAADFYARKQTELTCAIESHQYRDLLNKMLMYELRNISTGNYNTLVCVPVCRLRTIHGLNSGLSTGF